MKKILFFLVAALMLVPSLSFAASPWTTKATYKEKMMGKLDFGVRNLLGGWTEILTEPHEECPCAEQNKGKSAGDKASGVVVGIFRGVAYGLIDTAGGALHLVTFPITQVDVPLPENGVFV